LWILKTKRGISPSKKKKGGGRRGTASRRKEKKAIKFSKEGKGVPGATDPKKKTKGCSWEGKEKDWSAPMRREGGDGRKLKPTRG